MLTIIARSSPFEPESTVGRLISTISRSSGRSARYEHSESGCLSFLRPSTKSNAGKKKAVLLLLIVTMVLVVSNVGIKIDGLNASARNLAELGATHT